jgi:hypothetical protein
MSKQKILTKAKKSATKKQEATAKENFEKVAASAGLSHKELKAKLDRLGEMVNNGNWDLAYDILAGFNDAWLFEALLAGAKVQSDGTLEPGKELKRFKKHSQIVMLVAIAHLPEGVRVDESLDPNANIAVDINETNLELLGRLAPRLPNLRAASIILERIHGMSLEALEAVQSIAKHQGNFLLRVNSLSDEEAKVLAIHEGELSLEGLQSLSDSPGHIALAQKLAHQNCGGIYLYSLESLSDEAAKALAQHNGDLSLDQLESLSDDAVKALAKHKRHLSLGLRSLSDDAAEALAMHEGHLSLHLLLSLSDEAAKALAKHKGDLFLSSLDFISDEAAKTLAEHQGRIKFNSEVKRLFKKAVTWKCGTWKEDFWTRKP